MKKLFIIVLCAVLLCGAAFAEAVGMPNPIVEIRDDDAFEDRLHIEFDADDMYTRNIAMSIISDKVGQAVFTLDNVNGEPVEWALRFTRDAEFAKNAEQFSGIYDLDMSEPTVTSIKYTSIDPDDPDITLEITKIRANTEKYDIITWNYRGVYYCLTINGEYSQMQFAEVMDSIVRATIDD